MFARYLLATVLKKSIVIHIQKRTGIYYALEVAKGLVALYVLGTGYLLKVVFCS